MTATAAGQRQVVLRFDIDTHVCAGAGLRGLMEVAAAFDVPLTLFANMGRAVSHATLINRVTGRNRAASASGLSSFTKLGTLGIARALLQNPKVGSRHVKALRECADRDHEVALHGGRNHGAWHHQAMAWSKETIGDEVNWGIRELTRAIGKPPLGFASPGWTSPGELPGVLSAQGLSYLADQHGSGATLISRDTDTGIALVGTRLTGEPGGVGFLEHHVALKTPFDSIVRLVERESETQGTAVLYDHPCFAGRAGQSLLRLLIGALLADGFRLVTMADLVRQK